MSAPMPAAAADWIYRVVLTDTYRDSCTIEGNPRTIVDCRCHAGQCGHCDAGRHHLCRTRRDGPLIACETYIVNHRGGARTDVWLAGRPCRWMCSCDCPPPEPEVRPALFDAVPVGVKRYGQPETRRHRELFGQLGLFDVAGGAR
ncbi:DUF6248 family natural product biosynthesis protein [Actinoplanes lobatus]|uniref:Uncharacterized protein n=1 Tax=Actinoplanes lobatus TaxID=113568 RepID=A0A7W7HRJ1_9ACTN|nr:DUF6248 family natural product biosynthesis protein [Actinoplanes lobatus]MBB4755320.1 hypothetical protein [Actinoplanes lobatus]GIE46183.1 hypothetical protein Alo02nite_90810 [Actinoplanes lobatus]